MIRRGRQLRNYNEEFGHDNRIGRIDRIDVEKSPRSLGFILYIPQILLSCPTLIRIS